MRIRRVLRRCLIVTLTVVCAEAFSSRLNIPRFAFRIPHSAFRVPNSHKIHVSVTYLEFNQPKQTVEIVVRVFTDDLENALSQRAKRTVKIDPANADKDRRVGDLVMAYLRSNFELKNKAGRPVTLSWNGVEGQVDMFWLYVKGRMPGGLDGAQIRNKLFCELFDDQVNIVNAKHQGKQIGLMFESKDEFKAIR
ncbi:MAG TPA: DUF6702 family protein [Blastocatellia bacterium]|nr:DUF6702 family protein [Blastocatellia bacterium]